MMETGESQAEHGEGMEPRRDVFMKPFVYADATTGAVRVRVFAAGADFDEAAVAALKPLTGDTVAWAQGRLPRIVERRREPIVYIDDSGGVHDVYGYVPYVVEVGNPEAARPGFWQTAIAEEQSAVPGVITVRLKRRLVFAARHTREIELAKLYWSLPVASPPDSPTVEHACRLAQGRELKRAVDPARLRAGSGAGEALRPSGLRYDLSRQAIYTIDGPETKDIDDAIDVRRLDDGSFLVGIHIADVTEFVFPGSPLDKVAYERATSYYLLNEVLHMLPGFLSQDLCSLNEGSPRLALSLYVQLVEKDGQAAIKGSRVFRSVIKSRRRLTYDYVDRLLQGEDGDAPLVDDLRLARTVGKTMQRLLPPALGHHPDGPGEDDGSRKLIERFMIITNRVMGEKLAEIVRAAGGKDAPCCFFRIQKSPSMEAFREYWERLRAMGMADAATPFETLQAAVHDSLGIAPDTEEGEAPRHDDHGARRLHEEIERRIRSGKAESDGVFQSLRSAGNPGGPPLKGATLHRDPARSFHHGLGISRYAWCTSPIRRYPDIINHRCLKSLLVNEKAVQRKYSLTHLVSRLRDQRQSQQALASRMSAIQACLDIRAAGRLEIECHVVGFGWNAPDRFFLTARTDKGLVRFLLAGQDGQVGVIRPGSECRLGDKKLALGDAVIVGLRRLEDADARLGLVFLHGTDQIRLRQEGHENDYD